MQKHVDELIRRAIQRRRLLMFLYRGRVRVVEPYLYGVNTAHHTVLSAWQKNQASRVSPRDCWRTYFVNHMRRVEVLPIGFEEPRATYNPNHPRMTRVIDRLSGSAPASDDAPGSGKGAAVDPLQLALLFEPAPDPAYTPSR
jgi:hypothetical protein